MVSYLKGQASSISNTLQLQVIEVKFLVNTAERSSAPFVHAASIHKVEALSYLWEAKNSEALIALIPACL